MIFTLTVAMVHSQNEPTHTMSSLTLKNALTFDFRYEGVKGSPFILKEWNLGILFPTGETPFKVNHINFDRHASKLCFRDTPEGETKLINKYLIDSFLVVQTSDTIQYIRSRPPGSSDFIFLRCIYTGKGSLFLDQTKLFVEADYEKAYSADRRYDEFKDQPVYYIRFDGSGELLEVKKNKKHTAALFGSDSDSMLEFMKSEKIVLNDLNSLVELMTYYDKISD